MTTVTLNSAAVIRDREDESNILFLDQAQPLMSKEEWHILGYNAEGLCCMIEKKVKIGLGSLSIKP